MEENQGGTESKLLEFQGAMTSAGVGLLCFIEVNAAVFQEIFEHFMLPSAGKLWRY